MQTATKNYDLNIWDKLGYFSEYKDEGWYIDVYEIPFDGSAYGSGTHLPDLGIWLTDEEAKRLTLGWEEELGGDYTPDSDFWLDRYGFFKIYKDIPERVAEHLRNLP